MDVDEFIAFYETRPDNERWQLIEPRRSAQVIL
jgi:hypothetical protein